MIRKIAVIGATGLIGEPVTKELISAGYDVTILARNVKKASGLFPGVKTEEADVFDPLSLLRALEGQDAVYISLSPQRSSKKTDRMPEREGIKNIIDVAVHHKLKRIALLSSLVQRYEGMNDFHWWIFQMKIDAINLIRNSGIPYSIFYGSTFMESLQRDVIRGKMILLVAGSEAKMWFVSAIDYGKQLAKAFAIAGDNNQEYAIQGPGAYNWNEAAEVIIKNSHKKLQAVTAPLGMLKFVGLISTPIHYGAKICEALNKYPEKFESENTWSDLGKPQITLQEYVQSL